jgi:hypothetical protein
MYTYIYIHTYIHTHTHTHIHTHTHTHTHTHIYIYRSSHSTCASCSAAGCSRGELSPCCGALALCSVRQVCVSSRARSATRCADSGTCPPKKKSSVACS